MEDHGPHVGRDALLVRLDEVTQSLDRAERRAAALAALARALAAAETEDDVTSRLAATLPQVLDCDAGAVWRWDPEAGEVRAAATVGLPPELHDLLLTIPVRPSETPELAELLARREPLVLNAGAVTPVLEQMLAALSLRAAIGVALYSGERLLGAVTASWTERPLEGLARDDAVQRLQGVADQTAVALAKVGLVEAARHAALHDGLTRLPNRELFSRRLEEALRGADDDRVVGVLLCDLDRFKAVNDGLGHLAGDEVLRQVADRLRAAVPAPGSASRLAGDEFSVLLPDAVECGGTAAVAAAVVAALQEPLRVEGHAVRITGSVGTVDHRGPGGVPERVLRAADAALYDAKRKGRNQVVASRGGGGSSARATSLARELRAAVAGDGLELHLQPVFAVDDDGGTDVVGAEALVRWPHPRLGPLLPAAFLGLAEDGATIVDLDLWVLERACREAARWARTKARQPVVGVNLSVRTLLDDRLYEAVRRALVDSGLAPHRLQLEVVESRALRDLPSVVDRLTAVRHLGVRVALDDFGTGFSTLSWLQQLPVDTIKVDRSLTVDTAGHGDERRTRVSLALLRGVVAVGAELGVEVLAEGVETPEQLDAVRGAGCRVVQGYLLGRPVPPEDLAALLG